MSRRRRRSLDDALWLLVGVIACSATSADALTFTVQRLEQRPPVASSGATQLTALAQTSTLTLPGKVKGQCCTGRLFFLTLE
jgi:hypothetical protein